MTRSDASRERDRILNDWFVDAFGDEDSSPYEFGRDVSDLLKYLSAHGLRVTAEPHCSACTKARADQQPETYWATT